MHETEVPASEGERGRQTGDGAVHTGKGAKVGSSMVHGVDDGRARLQRLLGEPLFPANRINPPRLSLAIRRAQPFSRLCLSALPLLVKREEICAFG